jgi:hypothetical protein
MLDLVHDPDLVFVHLSDIHFRKGEAGDIHDLTGVLRHELERDLRVVQARLAKIHGLIVSGDIAFGGKKEEFDYALGWLESLREQVDCPKEGVMVTPGNHDVDRDLVHAGVLKLQNKIRAKPSLERRDAKLAELLRDSAVGDQLLAAHGAYNTFAANYGCRITRIAPFWERDFPLAYGSVLKFRGISSTFISGPADDPDTGRMFYGGAQRQLLRHDGVHRVVVGHHPPSWTLGSEKFATLLPRILCNPPYGRAWNLVSLGRLLVVGQWNDFCKLRWTRSCHTPGQRSTSCHAFTGSKDLLRRPRKRSNLGRAVDMSVRCWKACSVGAFDLRLFRWIF